jgi:hypothetical protein
MAEQSNGVRDLRQGIEDLLRAQAGMFLGLAIADSGRN